MKKIHADDMTVGEFVKTLLGQNGPETVEVSFEPRPHNFLSGLGFEDPLPVVGCTGEGCSVPQKES